MICEHIQQLRLLIEEGDPPEKKGRTLYHITYHKDLASVAKHGLKPRSSEREDRGISLGSQKQHSVGKVFVTNRRGMGAWYSHAEDVANHVSDAPHKEHLTPVVLRAKNTQVKVKKDVVGSTRAPAGYTHDHIKPDGLQFYYNNKWHPIGKHKRLNHMDAYKHDPTDDYYYLKREHENPLHPPRKPVKRGEDT